jgi:hypothetical protein
MISHSDTNIRLDRRKFKESNWIAHISGWLDKNEVKAFFVVTQYKIWDNQSIKT